MKGIPAQGMAKEKAWRSKPSGGVGEVTVCLVGLKHRIGSGVWDARVEL